jgi:hypothetical protein
VPRKPARRHRLYAVEERLSTPTQGARRDREDAGIDDPAPVPFEMGEVELAVRLAIMTLLRAANSHICPM